jgi:hypothetical protein
MQRCASSHRLATSDDLRTAPVLPAKNPQSVTNETVEERHTLAEQLCKDRPTSCGTGVNAQERPPRLIMEKLAR